MKGINRILITLLVVLIAMIASLNMSCNPDEETGYKELVVREGIGHFSFEYPAFYGEPPSSLWSFETTSSTVHHSGAAIRPGIGVGFLFIYIFQVNNALPNADTMLDNDLNKYEQGLSDFRLLERTPIIVTGVQGESITYSYSGLIISVDYHEPQTGTAYTAYFDSEGLIWKIELIVDEYVAEQAKADFEHVLSTFKILE